ncbi:sensor histidine kinase [Chitinophaga solisilvae]|uniref:sensor histidine kinase n=1 Tax=Chitinophaga solisilvae TaxID=1233460 RepID=UPI00136DD4BE|nr:PAS domain-containing sensor histidine kinase [Chitinophaga solisilvae]
MTIFSSGNNPGFDILFEHATQGILLTDQAGSILLANPFIQQLCGYTATELRGNRVSRILPAFDTGTSDKESILINKSNHTIPVNISTTPWEQQHLVFITDLSAQKRAEAQATEKNNALTHAQHALKYETIISRGKDASFKRINLFLYSIWTNLDAILIVAGTQGQIRFFNPAAERMLGYPTREVSDINTLLLFHDREELTQRADQFAEELGQHVQPGLEALTIRARLNLPNEYEWTYIRKDGSRFPVSLTVSAIRDGKIITGYIAIGLDISARKKSETELRIALDKERELNILKSRFVSIASHEFRTPLSTVLSSTYLLSKYETTADHPKRQVHIQRITNAVNMLTDILNDFLSLGKIEEGKIQVRYSILDTGKYISQLLREMEGLKREQQRIEYNHEGTDTISLDANLLRHILMNLVSNAIKFSADDGVISVYSHADHQQLVLRVKDAGIGIAMADQQHLFERFFRGSNVDNIQGTGLGLHIVAKYTEIMKGRITFTSEENKGTEFTVTIPTPQN